MHCIECSGFYTKMTDEIVLLVVSAVLKFSVIVVPREFQLDLSDKLYIVLI